MPTPSPNGRIFVYFDVHYDKLYYETQYLLRSMHITRNTIEDCAGNGSWKCATESKLPGSKDLESLGERRRRNKIIINKLRRGEEKTNKNKKRKKTKRRNRRRKRKRRRREKKGHYSKKRFGKNLGVNFLPPFFLILFFWVFFEILRQKYVHLARALPYIYIYI